MTDLSGKTALVTGSTSGIGLAIARALAGHGCNVVLNGFGDAAEIEGLVNELGTLGAGDVIHHGADMSKPDEIEELFAHVSKTFGGVDVLVNNAGIQFVSPVEDFPTDKWNAIIAINLSSAFHTTRLSIPHMKANGWGRVVNIASAHSLVASPFKSAYVAAKHGIAGMTKSVALEVAEAGITVNAVSPGYVLTPLVEKQIPDTAKARGISEDDVKRDVILAAQPTKKFVGEDHVADTVLFLLSDAGSSFTGANLSIDGGWTAK